MPPRRSTRERGDVLENEGESLVGEGESLVGKGDELKTETGEWPAAGETAMQRESYEEERGDV